MLQSPRWIGLRVSICHVAYRTAAGDATGVCREHTHESFAMVRGHGLRNGLVREPAGGRRR